jgi:SAM-dependent methyltransferase
MSLVETLREHERAWEERPLLRRLYREWFELVASRLARVEGTTVEIGSGLGRLREVVPHVVLTDVEETPWSDAVVDAARLPWERATVANIVLVDVFHHLPEPARFLDECERVLRPGGRIVMLEPYVSTLSGLAYRLHHERMDIDVDPFAPDETLAGDPLEGNLALTTAAFFKHADAFAARWPAFRLVERRRFSVLLYPLSGGFTRRPLVPLRLVPLLRPVESLLSRALPAAAFRCLVTLERR